MRQKYRKYRKYRSKNKRRGIVLFVLILLLVFISISAVPVTHLVRLTIGQKEYNVMKVEQELAWFKERSGETLKIPLIRDADFWLRLNTGRHDGLAEALKKYADDQHQFWLFSLYMDKGELEKGRETLKNIKNKSRAELGEAAVLLAENNFQGAQAILQEKYSGLSRHEEALWAMSLAQTRLLTGEQDKAWKSVEEALAYEQDNPYLHLFKLRAALGTGKNESAREAIDYLETFPLIKEQPEYWTLKGLFYLETEQEAEYEKTLEWLKNQVEGEGFSEYLTGIRTLSEGELQKGREHLKNALQLGLRGSFKTDADMALKQVEVRLEAAGVLSSAP